MVAPLILTLKLDAATQDIFDAWRQTYFPPERNLLSAHLTLFHHLPGEELEKINSDLKRICAAYEDFPLAFSGWRFLGRGVAMTVESNELTKLRAEFARFWNGWLTPQDRQKFRPHITVQNKVAPDQARELYEKLSAEYESFSGVGEGVTLWHYLGGRWKLEKEFPFG